MNIVRDIKFIFRLFAKYPGSSLLGITVLGLGLGLSITAFALVNGVVWSSPGIKDSRRLVHMQWINDQPSGNFKRSFSQPEVKAIQQQTHHFEKIASYNNRSVAVHRANIDIPTLYYKNAIVSSNFFEIAQVRPLFGRILLATDMQRGADRTVVISHELWQTYFAGLPEVIGKPLQLNGWSYTVVGVMPAGFHLPTDSQLWVAAKSRANSKVRAFLVIGVLKEGSTIAQAEVEINQIADHLMQGNLSSLQAGSQIQIKPFNVGQFNSELKTILLFLSATAVLVFIVACANISSLLMMRVSRRQQELVIRQTLGADRIHIIIQVMLEGLLFALGGLVVGFQIYALASDFVWAWLQDNIPTIPYWWHMQVDWAVYLFAAMAVLFSTIVSSLIPALRAASKQAGSILKDESQTGSGLFVGRIAKLLVAIQIMCATVLSVIALTTILVTHYLSDWGLPYKPEKILTVRYHLSSGFGAGFQRNDDVIRFYNKVIESLQAMPGVDSVGISSYGGGVYQGALFRPARRFEIEGRETKQQRYRGDAGANIVTSGYFSIFDMQPLLGRLLLATDTAATEKVAVVNKHFVDAFLGGENPLNRRVRVERPGIFNGFINSRTPLTEWMTIVGVVPNIQRPLWPGEHSSDLAEIYIPARQRPPRFITLLLKVHGDVTRWIEPMRREVHRQVPSIAPMGEFLTIAEFLSSEIYRQSTLARVVVVFGGIALFIATVGLYGLISFTTILRRREFGIRFALGADNAKVFILVLKRAAWLLSLGLVSGLAIAISINNTIKQSLDGVNFPVEIPSYVIGIGLVVITSLIAVVIPAIQAVRVPPNEALRVD